MASHEIVPLKCPSCGSADTGPSKPLAFGAEFTCAKCGGTSVLIINRALLPVDALQRSGDQVCAICGRVADRKARFCQDGHKLVRSCINRDCGKEFAAHHQRCDYCGWPQEVKPGTPKAYELELDSALADLSNYVERESLFQYVDQPLRKILKIREESGLGKKAVASILSLLQDKRLSWSNKNVAWCVLARMGADASEAIPLLLQRTREFPDDWLCWQVLAAIAPQEVLPHCRKMIEATGRNLDHGVLAIETTAFIGKSAIPMLGEFCGMFSGKRGEICQKTINEMTEKGRKTLQSDSEGSVGYRWLRTDD